VNGKSANFQQFRSDENPRTCTIMKNPFVFPGRWADKIDKRMGPCKREEGAKTPIKLSSVHKPVDTTVKVRRKGLSVLVLLGYYGRP
jgi:hypothetical protein